jgi:radical SAM/Cys-rich protein
MMHATLPLLQPSEFPLLKRRALETLQVNLTYRCNQSCIHCHVAAGPNRTEEMDPETMALIPEVLAARQIQTLDLTGGAPELHPGFRQLVSAVRQRGVHVIDRCNLTILCEPGHEDLAAFLAANGVEIVASLPCYSVDNVDRQRGKGTFDKSITALQRLNELGYGGDDSGRQLNLVYNPQGAVLPPGQQQLEADYKRELREKYGIAFNRLYTIANMPIQRFGSVMISRKQFDDYLRLLKDNYNPLSHDNVMCRTLISVDWRGYLYDCDFNQQLGLPLTALSDGSNRPHLRDLLANDPGDAPIHIADHCYGCTAGQGSSCGGALHD